MRVAPARSVPTTSKSGAYTTRQSPSRAHGTSRPLAIFAVSGLFSRRT